MKGGNNDGYDHAVGLGTVGGNDADWTGGTFFIPNLTLADLEGSDAGLRATSYGEGGEGSLKLVADYEPPAPPPPEDNFFPTQDMSHVTLYFDKNGGEFETGDLFTYKIDNIETECPNKEDLDLWLADILIWLKDQGIITDDYVLLGAHIKQANDPLAYYSVLDDGGVDEDGNHTPTTPPGGEYIEKNDLDGEEDFAVIFPDYECLV